MFSRSAFSKSAVCGLCFLGLCFLDTPDRFYIPNASEFFEGLISLLQHCRDRVKENTDGGHAEFLARRQEEYQRTLCDLWVMYGRVTESAQENQLKSSKS